MRWEGRRQSANVEDRRGMPIGGIAAGGGLGTLILILLVMFLGGDPGAILNQVNQNAPPAGPAAGIGNAEHDKLKDFVSVVLADTEDVWNDLFERQFGRTYRNPKLVLFSGQVNSGCGFASAAVGPFYCPLDQKVYLDLSFFNELRSRFGAPGDFAMAYVIAHEIGHHVQNQLGVSDMVEQQRARLGKAEYNQLSVRLELQADFLAGVWAYHAQRTKKILDPGDLEEALRAASAIGDDTLQKESQGYAVPDSFTHGTSKQRVYWFRRGFETGDVSLMDELFERRQSAL